MNVEDAGLLAAAQARDLPIRDLAMLRQALTHKSLVPDTPLKSNERLEFLGDSVLGLVVNEYLCATFPSRSEGELAKAKALIVCKDALAAASRRMDLAPLMRIGHAEEKLGGRNRDSIIADAYEALVAVIYYESGYTAAGDFIKRTLAPEIEDVGRSRDWRDPKSILQEMRQAERRSSPVYRTKAEWGKPHDRVFTIEVLLDSEVVGSGTGKTKKEAQQAAAESALAAIQ